MSYLSWLHKTFPTRQRTAELLRPELEEQVLSLHDYELATRFLPGPNMDWHVSVFRAVEFTFMIFNTASVWCRNVSRGVWLWFLPRPPRVEHLEAPSRFSCSFPCGIDIWRFQAICGSLPVCELSGESAGLHCSIKPCRREARRKRTNRLRIQRDARKEARDRVRP